MEVTKWGGRYIITGTQIGTIKALLKEHKSHRAIKILNEIFEDNFIGDSTNSISKDVKILDNVLNDEKPK